MHNLSKILPIYLGMFVAHLIFSFLNIYIWLSKIKSGVYTLPFFDKTFQTWSGFTLAAWWFNAAGYIVGTLLIGWSYKTSMENFRVLYSAFVASQITSVLVSMLFLYLRVGEVPNRTEWIAIALTLIAALILTNSRN